jgi:arginine N-succinyltransferase
MEDVPTLLKLARMVHFINLPADKDIITDKVMLSRRSFVHAATVARDGAAAATEGGRNAGPSSAGMRAGERPAPPPGEERIERKGGEAGIGVAAMTARSDMFVFVLEEVGEAGGEKGEGKAGRGGRSAEARSGGGGVIGTSQIISHMGGPGVPNIYFQLTKREFFSTSLQQGGTHMVARLVLDESGPTELGGLILQPSFRGHPLRLGRFLSLVRFHFIGLHRGLFADRILAEMMGPLTPDGRSTLWEYLGRRFINLTYEEADRFCQYSKEFMISLLPRDDIYLTLLPPEARSVVGEVGPETLPARRMLEGLGFRYRDRIDPFDGGPNLDAATDEIPVVKATRRGVLGPAGAAGECTRFGIVSVLDEEGEFRAIETAYGEDRSGRVRLGRGAMRLLEAEAGMEVGVTPTASPTAAGGDGAVRGTSVPGRRRAGSRGAE